MGKNELCISYIDTLYEKQPVSKNLADIINSISGVYKLDWHRGIEELRGLYADKDYPYITKNDKKEIDARITYIKTNLPAFCPSALLSTRDSKKQAVDKIKQLTGLLHVDVDNYQGDLNELKKKLAGDKYIHLAFISPSGRGIKIFTRVQCRKNDVIEQAE